MARNRFEARGPPLARVGGASCGDAATDRAARPPPAVGVSGGTRSEKEQKEAERKVIEAQGRANAIQIINKALAQNPNYIKYLYVDKLSDKISVIISDQNTMDLKAVLGERGR